MVTIGSAPLKNTSLDEALTIHPHLKLHVHVNGTVRRAVHILPGQFMFQKVSKMVNSPSYSLSEFTVLLSL